MLCYIILYYSVHRYNRSPTFSTRSFYVLLLVLLRFISCLTLDIEWGLNLKASTNVILSKGLWILSTTFLSLLARSLTPASAEEELACYGLQNVKGILIYWFNSALLPCPLLQLESTDRKTRSARCVLTIRKTAVLLFFFNNTPFIYFTSSCTC